MNAERNPSLTRIRTSPRARKLRKDTTDAEGMLWAQLRGRRLANLKFRRQHPMGPFIADFCCPERKLVIELDGGQHLDSERRDRSRGKFLEARGYRVLRFWNNDVIANTEAVLQAIQEALGVPSP